jgi:hypothetical protein
MKCADVEVAPSLPYIDVVFHLKTNEVVFQLKAVLILFREVGSGQVGSDEGNSDNRANSAQFQVKFSTGAKLGKRRDKQQ